LHVTEFAVSAKYWLETECNSGNVVSTAEPLLVKDLDANQLDYGNYFTGEVSAKIKDFILLSKEDYKKLLIENGFVIQGSQRHLF
jgi:hypothetical protein